MNQNFGIGSVGAGDEGGIVSDPSREDGGREGHGSTNVSYDSSNQSSARGVDLSHRHN
jgi:hypothetical protein